MSSTTFHGAKRAAKRGGVGKKGADKLAEMARLDGVAREEINGSLRRFLDKQFYRHAAHYIKVFRGDVYVFTNATGPLITMYSLPGHLKHSKQAIAS